MYCNRLRVVFSTCYNCLYYIRRAVEKHIAMCLRELCDAFVSQVATASERALVRANRRRYSSVL